MQERVDLTLGPNLVFEVRFSAPHKGKPFVVLSSGFGPPSFERPLGSAVASQLETYGWGWVRYLYPERDPRNGLDDLLISSAMFTLQTVLDWGSLRWGDQYALFGNSFGANVALEIALLTSPRWTVVTNPVMDYRSYRERGLGQDAMAAWRNAGVTYLPYGDTLLRSSYRFLEEADRQLLAPRLRGLKCPTLILQGNDDPIVTLEPSKMREVGNLPIVIEELAQGGHTLRGHDVLGSVTSSIDAFVAAHGGGW